MQINSSASVLIPAYNHEAYIESCLDSCLNQVDELLEIIVIDDGSSDRTFELVCNWEEKHRNEKIKFVKSKRTNKGLCATLNELVMLATGEYIALLASDDLLVPGSIRDRKLFLEEHPDKLAVFGDAIPIDSRGIDISNSCLTGMNVISNKRALKSPKFLMRELLLRWNGSGPVLMLRRQAFDLDNGVGLFDENLFFEDRDMYLRLCAQNKLIFMDKIVAKYRVTPSSMSRSKALASRMSTGMMQANRKALNYCFGVSKWIIYLLIISLEGRKCWKPKFLWIPIGTMAEIVKRALLVLHDVQVSCSSAGKG
jgi:glycosyltransferase involved in cell wall biosynthesis